MAQTIFTISPLQGPAPPASRPRRAEGFSLLEVLVATVIMGMVMVVLLQVLTAALRAQGASWSHTQAVLVAEKILQENCEIHTMAQGTSQGTDGRYDYAVQVTSQYELADPFADKRILCSLIKVTVTWQEWGRHKTLELQTIRTVAQKAM
jgi:prepilin-type N-terminal cleavage/methylation domain-containing protein